MNGGAIVAASYLTGLGARSPLGVSDSVDPWEKVRAAVPRFAGHRQPRIPGSLGYYDPFDLGAHEEQFAFGRRYGLSAFCYELRWSGALQRQVSLVERLVSEPRRDVSFLVACVGDEASPLSASSGWERDFAHGGQTLATELAVLAADERYVRLDGRPLILLDPLVLGDSPQRTVDQLRAAADHLGSGPLFIGLFDAPRPAEIIDGVDALVESQPRPLLASQSQPVGSGPADPEGATDVDWSGHATPYAREAERCLAELAPQGVWLRSCLAGWDDSPMRGSAGTVLVEDEPERFGAWVRSALEYTYLMSRPEHWLLLVHSWNGWAQGSFLEPDVDTGTGRLDALRCALEGTEDLAAEIRDAGPLDRGALLETARRYLNSASLVARELFATWESPRNSAGR